MDKNLNLNIIIKEIKNSIKEIVATISLIAFITLIYLLFIHPPLFKDSVIVSHHGNTFDAQSSGEFSLNSLGIAIPGSSVTKTPASEVVLQVLKSDSFSKKILKRNFFNPETKIDMPLYKIIFKGSDKLTDAEFLHLANKRFTEKMYEVSKHRMTSLITISVETNNAQLTYDILNEIIIMLNEHLNFLQKNTAIQKTDFIFQRLEKGKQELEKIEKKYVEFQNENKSISQSPALNIERKAIERDLNIYTSLVSMLLQKLETTQLEVYNEVHEVLILEEAEVLPIKTNRRIFIMIGSILFGIVLSLFYVMYKLIFTRNYKII